MATKAKRHIHKYHRVTLTFAKVWACALPDCNHFMPKQIEAIVMGKASICWQCGDNMLLDERAMDEDKPRCPKCRLGIEEENELPLSATMKAFMDGKL